LDPATTSQAPMVNHIVKGNSFNSGESDINILAEGDYYFVDKTLTINQFLTGIGTLISLCCVRDAAERATLSRCSGW
jgi:hypothetical protein